MTKDENRNAFEANFKTRYAKEYGELWATTVLSLKDEEVYMTSFVESEWQGWQAAITFLAPTIRDDSLEEAALLILDTVVQKAKEDIHWRNMGVASLHAIEVLGETATAVRALKEKNITESSKSHDTVTQKSMFNGSKI